MAVAEGAVLQQVALGEEDVDRRGDASEQVTPASEAHAKLVGGDVGLPDGGRPSTSPTNSVRSSAV
jgi:hypothetical protein